MMLKSYTELLRFNSFEERFRYLKLYGTVGSDTFGFDRIFNQKFYRSAEWKRIRDHVITRDLGCDLGISDRPIFGRIIIHHMNPITIDDLSQSKEIVLDPIFLICVSHETHNAIHYGDDSILQLNSVHDRTKNDTCPWKKEVNAENGF